MPIRVSADFQTHVEEVFRGYITQLKPSYPANAGEAKLELTLQDDSVALDREQMRRVWGDDSPVSDLDILTELIDAIGLDADPECGEGQSSRSLSQDATPIKFLRDRARANGYELIFSEGQVYFGDKQLDDDPQPTILIYAGASTNCLSFEINDDAHSPDAVRFDIAPRESGDTPVTDVLQPNLTLLGSSPSGNEGSNLGTPSVWRITKEGDETEEETRARAQALANDNSFKVRATGELDGAIYGHVLHVGKPVKVDGAGGRYGGLYYVDKVLHAFNAGGYRERFELMRNGDGEADSAGSALSSAISSIAGLF
jgi:hypothetical protein